MITGPELMSARVRAGFSSRASFGEALGVSEKTVYNWETNGVPRKQEAVVSDLLRRGHGSENSLADASNYALVAEILRRLDQGGTERSEGNATPQTSQASVSEAQEDVAEIVKDTQPPRAVAPAARTGENQGAKMREQLDRLSEAPDDPAPDHENESQDEEDH